jgi:parvulin-like peptidyl-prolyl isomerase
LARRPPSRRAIERTPEPAPERKSTPGLRTTIIIAVVFLAAIAIVVVVSIYFFVWQDLWSPIIRVNDETINMDYLIRRMKYLNNTDDITGMLETITEEEFIRQGAPLYGIEITPDEVDEVLRDIARGENETISESEFKAWYRNALNETKLSDAEYREWLRTYMLADLLNEYFIERLPTAAEHIHLYIIILSSSEDAEAALARIEEGEDFSELARELSIDEETAEQGGDAGWWPYGGGLFDNLEYWAFTLETGQVSDIIGISEDMQTYAICMVTERQTREVEEDKFEVMKGEVFDDWLDLQWYTVDYDWLSLDGGDFDNYTMQWISLQLLKE